MNISVFDLFKIGIGPSSSHTMGPMRAAGNFIEELKARDVLMKTHRVHIELFGSLGATGVGHGSGPAVILGLEGESPEKINPDYMQPRLTEIQAQKQLNLAGQHPISFDEPNDLIYTYEPLPQHPNGMRFKALDEAGADLYVRDYFSVGGGFVVDEEQIANNDQAVDNDDELTVPYPFESMEQLLGHCKSSGLSISEIMMENESVWRSKQEVHDGLVEIWEVMSSCIQRGCEQEGILPGVLKVKRRASDLYQKLVTRPESTLIDSLSTMDWVNLYALAVNEENAAGGRVVTAPTNGAAGIVPAVMQYYHRFFHSASNKGIVRFMLTAAAVGMLCKRNASISGAEVGCQGEVGSACAMAAAGLAAVSGGTPEQIENAAEIAMEHNLGLTCDPIAGLVQIPCIERNAMASIKAINASRLALKGDGEHFVSLDKVIQTMRDTGADMQSKYKETSLGGLAVNVIEC